MTQTNRLKVVSYLAPNWFEFYLAVVSYLGRVLQVETQLVQGECDPLEDPLLLQDRLDLAFICGLPFVRYCRIAPEQLRSIAAPVMEGSRYQNLPIYFSDPIVNATSNINTFADLAGKTVCYNDRGSNSGYYLLCYESIRHGYPNQFFGKAIQSGSHQRSIRWVAEGLADCAAIDSTVLERELRDFPELSHQLRIIEPIGPCPMPPLIAANHLGAEVINRLQSALLQPDPALQAVMEKAGVKRYAKMDSGDYEAIAQIYDAVVRADYHL